MHRRTRVVNLNEEPYDVYIGRPSKWGNPFEVKFGRGRESVVDSYRIHLERLIDEGTITLEDLQELKGKRLGCFCKPLLCHGDVIAEKVEELCQQ